MRILLITQHYSPEIGAPPVRLGAFAARWASLGHDVTVMTAIPNHPTGIVPPEYRGAAVRAERRQGTTVIRHWVYATPNRGIFKRSLAHLSFALSLLIFSLFRGPRPDVVIVSSPPFLPVLAGWLISKGRRCRFVFEVRDLWPGIFADLGILREGSLMRMLSAVELFLYRSANAVVTVTKGFAEHIAARGIDPSRIHVIPNGASLEEPAGRDPAIRLRLGPPDAFIVLYLGTIGLSHGIENILDAAVLLRDERIRFVFVGEGAKKLEMQERARQTGLTNVTFLPAQPQSSALLYCSSADLCLVSHRNIPGFRNFVPSKIFEIMSCSRPMVAAVQGEAADILKESGAARVVKPGDPAAFAEAIKDCYTMGGNLAIMGKAGRDFVERNYAHDDLARKYAALLESITEGKK